MSKEDSNSGGSVKSFLKGVIAGAAAAAAYLFVRKKENRDSVHRWMHEARADVLEKLADMEEVSKEKYHQTVDDVLDTYQKSHDIGAEQLKEFRANLKGRWGRIKKEAQGGFEDAKARVKEAAEKFRNEAKEVTGDITDTDDITDDEGGDSDAKENSPNLL